MSTVAGNERAVAAHLESSGADERCATSRLRLVVHVNVSMINNYAHPARGVHRLARLGASVCRSSLRQLRANDRAAPHLRPGDRFEVCSALLTGESASGMDYHLPALPAARTMLKPGGGLTPSMGLVRMLREALPDIGLMVGMFGARSAWHLNRR